MPDKKKEMEKHQATTRGDSFSGQGNESKEKEEGKMSEYRYTWRNKWLTSDAQSIDDMIAGLRRAANELGKMKRAGVMLDPNSDIESDYADLVTNDQEVAERFGFDGPDEDEEGGEEDHEEKEEDEE